MPRNVKCKSCFNLNRNGWWCEKVLDSPDPDMIRDCQYFREKTNGDRIRAMSDEELAQFMCKTFMCQINNCPGAELCTTSDGKANGMLKWLRQPVKED